MRRVAIVVHAIYPGDPRVRRQSDALIDAGHEVDVFGLRQPGEAADETDGAQRIVRLPLNRLFTGFAGHLAEYVAFTAMATWRLAREHRRRRYDLVQVATVPDFLGFAALPEKLGGVPLLLDLHEDMPEFFRDRFAHRCCGRCCRSSPAWRAPPRPSPTSSSPSTSRSASSRSRAACRPTRSGSS